MFFNILGHFDDDVLVGLDRYKGVWCRREGNTYWRIIYYRPMYVTGSDGVERIEKRKLMNISISCNHRVVDGWDAASFVQALKRLLETPALILID